jgi:hypothetical protein
MNLSYQRGFQRNDARPRPTLNWKLAAPVVSAGAEKIDSESFDVAQDQRHKN